MGVDDIHPAGRPASLVSHAACSLAPHISWAVLSLAPFRMSTNELLMVPFLCVENVDCINIQVCQANRLGDSCHRSSLTVPKRKGKRHTLQGHVGQHQGWSGG